MVYPKYVIILDWYPYVSLFPDLLCNIGLSVNGLPKICNNFRLVSLRFSVP